LSNSSAMACAARRVADARAAERFSRQGMQRVVRACKD
jgi:hypothetical protein